jgi:S-formylglutathione hydrolase FrmB
MKLIVLCVLIVCAVTASLAFAQRAAETPKSATTAPAAPAPAVTPAPTAAAPAAASAPATQAVTVMPEGCVVERFDVPSPSMKRQIHALVVLPPEYKDKPDKRYPVLYALHGMGASYAVYSDMSTLRRALRERPMIVASFDGDNAGWYIDSTQKPGSQFTTFFFDEFIPYVDAHYRANAQRGVTGFSMGGYGAFHYMLCKPGMFASVSALSGAFSPLGDKAGKASPMLRGLLGDPEQNKAEYAKCAIYGRIEEDVKKHVKLPPLLFHTGTEDGLVAENREMSKFLAEQNKLIAEQASKDAAAMSDNASPDKLAADLVAARKINFLCMESPGAHSWPFWRDAAEGVIDFHWRSFRDAPK